MKAILILFCFVARCIAGPVLLESPAIGCNLVFHGDSITFGTGVLTNFVQYLIANEQPLVPAPYQLNPINYGIGGQGFHYVYDTNINPNNLCVDATNRVDPQLIPGKTNVLVTFAGTNDIWPQLGNSTAAQTYGYFTNGYAPQRVAAGWTTSPNKWVVVCMLPRQNLDDTIRQSYNALLVSGASTYGYAIARSDLDAFVGCSGCQSNLTYFQSDFIHPTSAGDLIISQLLKSLIFP